MLTWIIDFSLRNRGLVILAAMACAAFGILSMRRLDVDAFPDTTPVQVQINTIAPALGPEEVETQITFPVEQADEAALMRAAYGLPRGAKADVGILAEVKTGSGAEAAS